MDSNSKVKVYVVRELDLGIQVRFVTISSFTRKASLQEYDRNKRRVVTRIFRPGIDYFINYLDAVDSFRIRLKDRIEIYEERIEKLKQLQLQWFSA